MAKHECPDCGFDSLKLTGKGQATCTMNDDSWSRWFVEDAMDIIEVACNECGYRLTGDRVKEFGF